MAGAQTAPFSLLGSLANATSTTRNLLKPLLSSSISTPLPPKKLAKRKNRLRPKILKTLTKPLSIDPVIPTILSPQKDTVFEPVSNELVGIAPAIDEVDEVQVTETEGVPIEYSGGLGKLSAMSVFKVGLGLVGVLVFQTICAVCFLGGSNSDEKKKNFDALDEGINVINKRRVLLNEDVVYLDRTELEYKINEIRAMAREVRKIEEEKRENCDGEGGIYDEFKNSKGRLGLEREIGTRLSRLQKELNSGKGKSLGSYMDSLNEIKDVEDAKEVDKTLMFKKKFKFRSPSTSLRTDAKGFSSLEDGDTYKKEKSGIAGPNGDSRETVFGIMEREKNGSEALSGESKCLQSKAENLEKRQKGMGVGNTYKKFGSVQETSAQSSLVEVMKSREAKDMEEQNLQNFAEERQETNKKSDKDALLLRKGGSLANIDRDDQSDINSDLWWLKLPYVLAILMRRGADREGPGGLFTLRTISQMRDQSEISYTVAFEDRGDANNFCHLLESFFEDLGDFSADIVPLSVKDLLDEVKSGKEVIVVKKRQLKLYAGQPLADVERALFSLVEQNSSFSTRSVE